MTAARYVTLEEVAHDPLWAAKEINRLRLALAKLSESSRIGAPHTYPDEAEDGARRVYARAVLSGEAA